MTVSGFSKGGHLKQETATLRHAEQMSESPPPDSPPSPGVASVRQRVAAAGIGIAAGVAGTAAVFETLNELGTAALFLVSGAFLICATFGVVPTRLKVGDNEVSVGRAALHTLEQIVSESDTSTQDQVIDKLEANLALNGITRTRDDAVASMLGRFQRYSGSDLSSKLHDELLDTGWVPSTPAKATYIRWSYAGAHQQVNLFQNSAALVAASNRLVDVLLSLPGAEHRMPKNEVAFNYSNGLESALLAAERVRQYANKPA